MYLRTTQRKNRDGSTVAYFQLAHNHWDADRKRSRVEIIHNFGRADQLDREALVRLCKSVARVCELEVRDPRAPEALASAADALADDLAVFRTRALGSVLVVGELWERLGIGPALRTIAKRTSAPEVHERALLAMVTNRLTQPTSKLGVWERWLDTVHLPDCEELKLGQVYEAMDFLHGHSEEVERSVFFETANLLNLQVDLVFYDTTTAEFAIDEGDADEGGWRQFGYSKDDRWTPQVVVALAVTREGLPVRSWVFPGNTADVTTVQRIREDLRGWKLHRTLFVGDAGMNSQANRQELARACGRYVLASRTTGVSEVERDVMGRPGRFKKLADNLFVKEVVVGTGELRRRYLVCKNPEQEVRERHHRDQVIAELEEELGRHPSRDARAKWAIGLMASGRYGRYLRVRAGKLEIDRKKVRDAARYDGKWVLITNDDTLSPDDAATAYKGMLVIERCFRTLKSTQIRVRPMYHRLERRIEAHVKLCVLALLVARVAELACGRSWMRILDALDTLQATEFRTDAYRFFRSSTLVPEARRVLSALDIKPPKQVLGASPVPDGPAHT